MKRLFFLIAVVGIACFLFVTFSRKNNTEAINSGGKSGHEVVTEDRGMVATKSPTVPFTFSTKRLDVHVTKETHSLEGDAQYLVDHAEACGPKDRPAHYYEQLRDALLHTQKTVYSVSEQYAADQPSLRFYITTIPNVQGYQDLITFKEDFFRCGGDEGNPQPFLQSADNLLFIQECKEPIPHCAELNKVVEEHLVFKPIHHEAPPDAH